MTLEEDMARDLMIKDHEPEKASEVVKEVDSIFTSKKQRQKSNLIAKNVRGMNRAFAFQNYMQKYFGFRIDVLNTLIETKLELVKSRDGWGTEQLKQYLGTLQNRVETNIGVPAASIGDKLAGRDRR